MSAVALGCDAPGIAGGDSPVVERSMRGDTLVVTNVRGQAWAANGVLDEVLRIGEADGAPEYTFASIVAIVARGNGPVYVYDHVLHLLRMYDARGTYVRQIGRRGGGPGEYRYVIGLAMFTDGRLAAWDVGGSRINVYSPSGDRLYESVAGSLAQFFIANPLAVDTAGRFQIVTRSLGRLRVVVVDSTGTVVDTLRNPRPRLGLQGLTSMHPTFEYAIHPHGHWVWADGDRYAVHLRTPAGEPMRIVRTVEAVPLTPGEKANVTERLRDAPTATRADGSPAPITAPTVKPFIRNVWINRDGSIWVMRPAAPRGADADPRDFDVFSPDGTFLGSVPVPPKAQLHAFDGPDLWGHVRDDDDVPYVVHYKLRRGALRPLANIPTSPCAASTATEKLLLYGGAIHLAGGLKAAPARRGPVRPAATLSRACGV